MIKELIQKIFIFFGYKIINLKKNKSNLDQYLKTLINYNPLIFDVGANNGQSVENFKKIYPEAKFHCFEPNPDVWNILDKNYKDNKNVVTNIIAVSDQIGTNKFHIYANSKHSSFNKLIPNHQYTKERSKTFNLKESEYLKKIVDVKTITLDKYCEENNIKNIDILKIDTEGSEFDVLKGLNDDDFKIIKFIFFEHHYDLMLKKDYKFSNINSLLKEKKFKLCFKNKMRFRKTFEYIYEKK